MPLWPGGRMAAWAAGLAVAGALMAVVAMSPQLAPRGGALLQVGNFDRAKAAALASAEYDSLADESAGIVTAALKGEGRDPVHRSPLESLAGFTPEKDDVEVEPVNQAKARKKYQERMGDRYKELMGDSGPLPSCGSGPWWYDGCECVPSANVTCNATLDEVDHEFYGNARNPHGWHYGGPTEYPWKLAPLRRRLGYNRMAPMGTGSFYREYHPFRAVNGPNTTGIYHPPGFDNTYYYTMPSSPQWIDSQKRAASNGGYFGLTRSRWPKGKPGYRYKSMSHVSTLKTAGARSAWPQKGSWHWNHWDAIPDPQRAHEETVGSLDPESEANLQLTYGRAGAAGWFTPSQKFGGINGDKFLPYKQYKEQLNGHHPEPKYGFDYLHAKYYKKDYKDLVQGSAIDKLDNKGWGVVDTRIPVKDAVDQQAPEWLRKLRSNGGEPVGDALHNFWQGGNLVDAAPGGGGRSDVLGYKEGKAGEAFGDHYGWLEDAPKGHLLPFRGRRPEPDDEASYNQNEFDAGESFRTKAKGLSQLAQQRQKLLDEGRHLHQQLQLLNSKIKHTEAEEASSGAAKRSPAQFQSAMASVGGAFDKANAAFARAMALQASVEGAGGGEGARAGGRRVAGRFGARAAAARDGDAGSGGALFKV